MESIIDKQQIISKLTQNCCTNLNSTELTIPKNTHNGSGEADTVYYGVHIPSDIQPIQDHEAAANVYDDKAEALKVVKKYKKARFKAFNDYQDALDFASYGSEHINGNLTIGGHCQQPDEILVEKQVQPAVGEKPAAFRGPKSQDLVRLRKAIEAGNLETVYNTVWENPRYLISSGDTPAILQEGARYNALHIAAKAKNRNMCELILSTISNSNFITLLYGEDNFQDTNGRANILLDLYLNTPDKGLNETPLHFAVKYGAVEVVELLVSFPQCDKSLKNRFGVTVNKLICDRCENPSESLKKKIKLLLEETYYVPVLRSDDSCIPPLIGEPFIPTHPPSFNSSPLLPKMEIKAYAGPMDREGAEKFRRVWKTPPRSLKVDSPVKNCSFNNSCIESSPVAVKFKDLDKGLERVGRVLANKFEVGWKEYWPFLDSFINLASEEGLELLENYLRERELSEMSSSNSSVDMDRRGIESNFLSPISDLCKNFEAFSLSDVQSPKRKINFLRNDTKQKQMFENNFFFKKSEILEQENFNTTPLNPLLYLERSCQVFANRFSNDILCSLENDYDNPTEYLENQLKPLQLSINSFIEDKRFEGVDFQLVHCRLGNLIGLKLREVVMVDYEHECLRKTLENWLLTCSKRFDYFSSDDESCNQQTSSSSKKGTSKNKQIMCLLGYVLNNFMGDGSTGAAFQGLALNESECVDIWSKATACSCVWHSDTNRRNNKRTVKRNYSCYKSTTDANIVRQLFSTNDTESCVNTNCCDRTIFKLNVNGSDQSDDGDNESCSSEEYYTPPTSPITLPEDDDNDIFEDSCMPERTIFIEGSLPTKSDYAVFNAVNCAEDRLDCNKFPHVYNWHHAVSLYDEEERKNWSSVHCFSTNKNGKFRRNYCRGGLSINI